MYIASLWSTHKSVQWDFEVAISLKCIVSFLPSQNSSKNNDMFVHYTYIHKVHMTAYP